jgi:hypothetical protein
LLLTPAASAAGYGYGTIVSEEDHDYVPSLDDVNVATCVLDDDGGNDYDAGETIVLLIEETTCGDVMGEDIPLVDTQDVEAGHEISADDEIFAKPVTNVSHGLVYFDGNGDAEFDDDDHLYLNVGDTSADQVSVGDVRLTPARGMDAATVVENGDPDVADNVNDLGSSTAQLWKNNVFVEAGDGFYVNADRDASDTAPEADDVRLNVEVPDPTADTTPSTAQPELAVNQIRLASANVTVDQDIRATLTVENVGEATGSGLVETSLGDELVDARGTPTLASGDTAQLVVTVPAPDQVGTHAVRAGDASTQLEIRPSSPGPAVDQMSQLRGQIGSLEQTVDNHGDAIEELDAEQVEPASEATTTGSEIDETQAVPGLGVLAALIVASLVAIARTRA